jgi:acetyl esterase/lipase
MTGSPAERRIRAALPIIRLLNAYLPLEVTRRLIARSMARVQLPATIGREVVSADGVRAEWLLPHSAAEDCVLCYVHGGSFVLGLTSLHVEMVATLAQLAGVRALMVDYRLAPEHPFPAPLADCVTAYRWLLKQDIAAQNVLMAGDSAGGNLILATLMKLRDGGDPLPAAAACLSPVADLTNKGALFQELHDPLLHPRAARFAEQAYVADNEASDPSISPALGDWHDLPPLLIHAGEDELLRYDAMRVTASARKAGVEARLAIYPRMWHVWQLIQGLPQAAQALDEIAHFLKSHLKQLH